MTRPRDASNGSDVLLMTRSRCEWLKCAADGFLGRAEITIWRPYIRQVFSAKRTSGIFEKCSSSLSASPPCLCLGHTVSASTSSHAVYTHRWGGATPPKNPSTATRQSEHKQHFLRAHAPSACYTQAEHAARRPGWLPLEAKAELQARLPPSQKFRRGTGFPSGSCEPSTAREGLRGLLRRSLSI